MSSNIPFLILLTVIPCLVSSQFCEHLEIIPHPQWCSSFLLCRFGFWTVIVCPNGLMFNPEKRHCDYPENVDCINDPSLTAPEWTTRTVTYTAPTDLTDPTLSTPTDPTFSAPTPTFPTFSTPDRPTTPSWTTPSWTTPSWTTPSWATPSWTTPTWTTPTRPSIPTRASTKFCADSRQPSTLSHLKCEYFYKCIDGNAFEMKCGNGLVWNSKQEFCDSPQNFICVNEPIPQSM